MLLYLIIAVSFWYYPVSDWLLERFLLLTVGKGSNTATLVGCASGNSSVVG